MFSFCPHLGPTGEGPAFKEGTMAKKHDWNKEQPHHAKTGKFVKEDYAKKNPDKVVWVKED